MKIDNLSPRAKTILISSLSSAIAVIVTAEIMLMYHPKPEIQTIYQDKIVYVPQTGTIQYIDKIVKIPDPYFKFIYVTNTEYVNSGGGSGSSNTVYVDRPIEVIKEVPVEVIKEVLVEVPVIVEVPVEDTDHHGQTQVEDKGVGIGQPDKGKDFEDHGQDK